MLKKIRKIFTGIISGRLNTSFAQRRFSKHASKVEEKIGKTPMLLAPLAAGWLCYAIASSFAPLQNRLDIILLFLQIYSFEMGWLFLGKALSKPSAADGEHTLNPFPGFFMVYVIAVCIRWLFVGAFVLAALLGLLAKAALLFIR